MTAGETSGVGAEREIGTRQRTEEGISREVALDGSLSLDAAHPVASWIAVHVRTAERDDGRIRALQGFPSGVHGNDTLGYIQMPVVLAPYRCTEPGQTLIPYQSTGSK